MIGSFQLYTRWFDYGRHGNIMGDEEWGLLKPGSKGWVFGFKYVPAKNIEWKQCMKLLICIVVYGEKISNINVISFVHR